jgi:hypothetical protein
MPFRLQSIPASPRLTLLTLRATRRNIFTRSFSHHTISLTMKELASLPRDVSFVLGTRKSNTVDFHRLPSTSIDFPEGVSKDFLERLDSLNQEENRHVLT